MLQKINAYNTKKLLNLTLTWSSIWPPSPCHKDSQRATTNHHIIHLRIRVFLVHRRRHVGAGSSPFQGSAESLDHLWRLLERLAARLL